jgi:hypothetical protein
MNEALTQHEARMRQALYRELKKASHTQIVPDRVDIITKHWVIAKTKQKALILEGRLIRNVWSGDITISYRRYTVKLS